MCLFRSFYPDEYYDSAYEIDYKKLYDEGFRAVIYDIDNTLVPQDAPADEHAHRLMDDLRKTGWQVMLLSNNKPHRVEMFVEGMDIDYIAEAKKPLKDSYLKAMEKMGTTVENTIFIGDQLFTDILGANKAGIKTYLVKPIDPKEEFQIVLKRRLEWIVLLFRKKKK